MQILDQIHTVRLPTNLKVSLPSRETGFEEDLKGSLYLSREGYVYSAPSKIVVWIKFLALGISLPIGTVVAKIWESAKQCFGHPPSSKGMHDIKHLFHLSHIAWKGVLGFEAGGLMGRIQEFALAEIDYNHSDRSQALELHRSTRFEKGLYNAPCMQPLFHRSDALPIAPLQNKIQALKQKKEGIEEELRRRQMNGVRSYINSFLTAPTEYETLSTDKLIERRDSCAQLIEAQEKLLERSKRCYRYVTHALARQQCCSPKKAKVSATVLKKDEGNACFRQEKICGCVYKIDCCATRCWAIDCLCCICCFWPEGRACCIL